MVTWFKAFHLVWGVSSKKFNSFLTQESELRSMGMVIDVRQRKDFPNVHVMAQCFILKLSV